MPLALWHGVPSPFEHQLLEIKRVREPSSALEFVLIHTGCENVKKIARPCFWANPSDFGFGLLSGF